ncbi:MAG: hypothetical protein IJ858_04200 [Acidaminococcaceae bacterium]|nr:hypothetical protein [Acidaminococcaceae bacterium]
MFWFLLVVMLRLVLLQQVRFPVFLLQVAMPELVPQKAVGWLQWIARKFAGEQLARCRVYVPSAHQARQTPA